MFPISGWSNRRCLCLLVCNVGFGSGAFVCWATLSFRHLKLQTHSHSRRFFLLHVPRVFDACFSYSFLTSCGRSTVGLWLDTEFLNDNSRSFLFFSLSLSSPFLAPRCPVHMRRCYFLWLSSCMSEILLRHHKARLPKLKTVAWFFKNDLSVQTFRLGQVRLPMGHPFVQTTLSLIRFTFFLILYKSFFLRRANILPFIRPPAHRHCHCCLDPSKLLACCHALLSVLTLVPLNTGEFFFLLPFLYLRSQKKAVAGGENLSFKRRQTREP